MKAEADAASFSLDVLQAEASRQESIAALEAQVAYYKDCPRSVPGEGDETDELASRIQSAGGRTASSASVQRIGSGSTHARFGLSDVPCLCFCAACIMPPRSYGSGATAG